MKNQLKAGALLSYINIGANALIAVCYTPIMLRLLGQSEYGLYTLVAGIVSCLSMFNFGASSAYLRFSSRYQFHHDETAIAKLNGTFLILFMALGAVTLVCGGLLTAFSDAVLGANLTAAELETARVLMGLMVLNLALTFPNTVFNAIISSRECFVFQRALNLLVTLLTPLVTLPLLFLGFRSVTIVVVSVILSVLQILVNLIFCVRKINAQFSFFGFDRVLVREIFAFSFFIFLNLIIDQVNWNVDKYLLGRFHGTNEVAVYGVASQISNIFMMFSTAISSVFSPRINKLVAQGGCDDEINRLFVQVGRMQAIILSLFATGFIFFGRKAIELWAGVDYGASYPTALLLVLPTLIPLVQNLGIEIQRAKNKHQFRSVVYAVIAAANILISIPLSRMYGSAGSALGTAIAVIVGNILVMNWYYQKHLQIDIVGFWKNLAGFLPALILPAVAGTAFLLFAPADNLWIFFGGILAYTALFIGCMWLFGMNREEKNLFWHSRLSEGRSEK